ncbi:MAG: EAL domain-containing protein [Planctomycetaceae bacterium]
MSAVQVGERERRARGAAQTPSAATAIVARQPIFTVQRSLFGYELLYRSDSADGLHDRDGRQLTSTVLLNVFSELGLTRVVGDRRAFVNLPREFLTGQLQLPECPEQLVAEILESVEIDDEVLAGVQTLKDSGFLIALDDVIFSPQLEPLLHLADIVKVELPAVPTGELAAHVEAFRRWPVKLLAEKVETEEQMQQCVELGFDYFQGYLLARPMTMKRAKLDVKTHVVLQLLARLYSGDHSFRELTQIIHQDPALCTKLLRYMGSSRFGARNVASVEHAIGLLGNRGMKTLLTMVQLVNASAQPPERITAALVRGLMCAGIAAPLTRDLHDQSYLLGVLSELDAILDEPLSELLNEMPISPQLRAALLSHEGELGALLLAVTAYERGDWDQVQFRQLPLGVFGEAYLAAMAEAEAFAGSTTA